MVGTRRGCIQILVTYIEAESAGNSTVFQDDYLGIVTIGTEISVLSNAGPSAVIGVLLGGQSIIIIPCSNNDAVAGFQCGCIPNQRHLSGAVGGHMNDIIRDLQAGYIG